MAAIVAGDLMLRPTNITQGNIPLTTNLLAMKVPTIELYHYAVSIEPMIAKRLNNIIVKNVLEQNKDKFEGCVYGYDGNFMIVTNKKIENIVQQEKVGANEITMKIEFKNAYSSSIDELVKAQTLTETEQQSNDENGQPIMRRSKHESTMQCLEILLRSYQAEKYLVDGRRIVTDSQKSSLSGCIEIWYGVSQRIKMLNGGLFLNVDCAHVMFYEPLTLIQVIEKQQSRRGEYVDLSRLGSYVFRDLSKFLKMVRLETIHRKRNIKFKACDITETSAQDTVFTSQAEEGGPQTDSNVASYFEKAYGPLKYPFLPCVVVKKKDGNIFFPLEVCKICPGQKYAKRLNDFQTSEMIKMVSKPAASRFTDLEKRMQTLEVANNQILSSLNVSVDTRFYTCMGKQLNAPDIKFLDTSVKPQRGSWNLRNVKLIKSVAIQKWSVFILADLSPQDVNRDISNFTRICTDMGMKIANPMEVRKCSLNDLEKHITDKNTSNDTSRKTDYELVMVILQDRNASNYQEVKRICDLNCNVISQCIIKRNVEKLGRDASFCSNIAIKVNTKLGGINYCTQNQIVTENSNPSDLNDDMVIFGIDVTHPGTGDMSNNSIAAVVSSIDDTYTRYHTSLRMQERRKEIIEDLRHIVKEHLAHYRQTTNKKPKKVLVFRDGIGDSSLQTVYFREIEEIRNAFKELNEDYNPELTFVIVQKKHSIRFKGDGRGEYVKDPRRGPTCNPSPGTLIDSLGTKYNDFYMISHFALQGTPCPVKYHVLVDDIKIKNFSQFIYDQCHIFSRATKAVSVVPVVYYAHLAAARAKCYVQDEKLMEVSDAFKNVLWYL